jgi:hypothetical protein
MQGWCLRFIPLRTLRQSSSLLPFCSRGEAFDRMVYHPQFNWTAACLFNYLVSLPAPNDAGREKAAVGDVSVVFGLEAKISVLIKRPGDLRELIIPNASCLHLAEGPPILWGSVATALGVEARTTVRPQNNAMTSAKQRCSRRFMVNLRHIREQWRFCRDPQRTG